MKEYNIKIKDLTLRLQHINNYPDRPTIIFLHESFGCIKHWKEFPAELGKSLMFNVVVYDRQGYGESCNFFTDKRNNDYLETEADILNLLLEHLNINNAILYGHSDGGSIALITAAKYQNKISAIITEGAHIFVEEITLCGIKKAVDAYNKSNLKEKLQKYHGDKTDMLFRMWHETWLSESFRNWNIENLLPHIQCPVLVIQGLNDEYGTIKQVEGIANLVSGKSYKYLPEAGHTPHKDTKEAVISRINKFINVLI